MQDGHNFQKPEIEAAKVLARHGYSVVLQPESKDKGGVSFRLGKNGGDTFPEGRIGSLWYEQFTSQTSSHLAVKNSLKHGHEKGVELALLFNSEAHIPLREIERGIRMYGGQSFKQQKTVTKFICVCRSLRGKGWEISEYDIEK